MRRLILTGIAFIAFYTVVRNNVFKLPDQIIWSTNFDIIYKTILPTFMLATSVYSIVQIKKTCVFVISFMAMILDAFNRLSTGINYLYYYFVSVGKPIPPVSEGSVRYVVNLWPSSIMLAFEIVFIFLALKYIINLKITFKETDS